MGHRTRIPLIGKLEVQFWIRAFGLQSDIDSIIATLNEKAERKQAFCPIIYEYEAGSMKYHALLGVRVDPLGLIDGQGFIWISAGKEHHELAEKERDEFADEMTKTFEKHGGFDEVKVLETKRET